MSTSRHLRARADVERTQHESASDAFAKVPRVDDQAIDIDGIPLRYVPEPERPDDARTLELEQPAEPCSHQPCFVLVQPRDVIVTNKLGFDRTHSVQQREQIARTRVHLLGLL